MPTIPASTLVAINPSVVSAGGTALDLSGLILTRSTRVPIGTVASFPIAAAASAYFGATDPLAIGAGVYFSGFDGSDAKPAAMLVVQYPASAVSAYLRGGNISGMSNVSLQALSGSLSIVVDGYTRTNASISLSGAASFSAAATIIAGALSVPTIVTGITGSIGPGTASFTASISGQTMYVTAVAAGTIVDGGTVAGSGVLGGTIITGQLSGVAGGAGTYAVNLTQVAASAAMTEAYGIFTASVVGAGVIAIGQTVSGTGVTASTEITQLGTGTGGTGTYYVAPSQTVPSQAMTMTATPITVTYDSVSGGFLFTSGTMGSEATIAFATGTLAAPLLLTQSTGAVLSQGAEPTTPAAFMSSIVNLTQNWATFMLHWDPDGGTGGGNVQKQAFAAWKNTQNNRFGFVCWDQDLSPTTTVPATTSLGNILQNNSDSGTCLINTTDVLKAFFVCGAAASINFQGLNGRITFAFKWQAGLTADVTDPTVASNLIANGYNYGGAYATAATNFTFFYNGQVTGPFKWFDAFVNQIWLSNGMQLALVNLLTQVKSVPYNSTGNAQIEAALLSIINQALNFAMFAPGVALSSSQIAAVNAQAGTNIATTLQNRGWYLQILPATAQVRAARGTPPMSFWYSDAGSVQKISLSSIAVQ
jgi:hypothetical protein